MRQTLIHQGLVVGISIIAVVILILTSFTNVIGYQTIQSSNQSVIKERINQRELLFQTIVDIANNKEIQRIILKSQISRGIFPTSEIPVLTKSQLKQMYFLGLILSKVISKSRIQSMIGKYQFNNQEIQQEINAVIERDTILDAKITQLKSYDCDCESENTTRLWNFPIICTAFLLPLAVLSMTLINTGQPGGLFLLGWIIALPTALIASVLNCWWLGS